MKLEIKFNPIFSYPLSDHDNSLKPITTPFSPMHGRSVIGLESECNKVFYGTMLSIGNKDKYFRYTDTDENTIGINSANMIESIHINGFMSIRLGVKENYVIYGYDYDNIDVIIINSDTVTMISESESITIANKSIVSFEIEDEEIKPIFKFFLLIF